MCPTVAVAIISMKRELAVLVGIAHSRALAYTCTGTRAHTQAQIISEIWLFCPICPAYSLSSLEGAVGTPSEDVLPVHPLHCPSPGIGLGCLALGVTVARQHF